MPRQNRVTPMGEIVAQPWRGLFMGNRGCLHDAAGRIRRDWQVRRWITCLTAFNGRRRALMRPGHYTELFFLDEAVAAAAGHRPCAECRRAAHLAFRAAWTVAHGPAAGVEQIDLALHRARMGGQVEPRPMMPAAELPDGAFVRWQGSAYLVAGGRVLPWSAEGYGPPLPRPAGPLEVLTPMPLVLAMRAGWQVVLHPSAGHDLSS